MSEKGTAAGPYSGVDAVVGPVPRPGIPRAGGLIVADLRGQIVRGELNGGDSLPSENELMRLYGVSRPTLREALRVLESDGLLTVRRGAKGGSTVHVPDGTAAARAMRYVLQHRGATLADVLEARSIIEPACARLVAEGGKKAHLLRLRAELSSITPGSSDSTEISRFHELLVELAGNQTLMLMYGMLRVVLHESDPAFVECADTRHSRRRYHAHQHLVDLIERRAGDQAEEFWTEHLREGGVARRPASRTPLNFTA